LLPEPHQRGKEYAPGATTTARGRASLAQLSRMTIGVAPDPIRLRRDAVERFGTDAVSFQALKVGASWWHDQPAPAGTGALVAYVASGGSWIAVGTPLAAPPHHARAVERFCAAARASGMRPVFFGVENCAPFAGCRTLRLGLQPVLRPSEWDALLRRRPKLREQLRRARAKGVIVRAVDATELADGAPLRQDVARLRREWLASRAMEPLGFLVDVDPDYAADAHLYYVAERGRRVVQFLSAVPVPARHGWLMEDMLRGAEAPNGTTELLIAALMRRLEGEPYWVTPGLTPLVGAVAWWLGVTRRASVALYDFSGLWRFRSRLQPSAWTPIWLAWDHGPAPLVLVDVLRAFARGQTASFACRTLVRHPNGPPWVVAVPLVAWIALLAVLLLTGRSDVLAYPPAVLLAWLLFDIGLAWALFAVARRPRIRHLLAVAAVASLDAVLSVRHLMETGLGDGPWVALARGVATAGPVVGTAALLWAAWRAWRAASRRAPTRVPS
jgi:phosphatidylglycerol lysyltransferase